MSKKLRKLLNLPSWEKYLDWFYSTRTSIVIACFLLPTIPIFVFLENPTSFKDFLRIYLENGEVLAVFSAMVLYFKEARNRKKKEHYEAWQVINSAQGQTGSGGRVQALEDLNQDGIDLEGVAAPEAELSTINLKGGLLQRANFRKAALDRANFQGANLTQAHLEMAFLWGAHLEKATLMNAHLEEANLIGAHLEGANLMGARLEGAKLNEAHLEGANLWGTHLHGANLMDIQWDSDTNWKGLKGLETARNIPEALKAALRLPNSSASVAAEAESPEN
jgi:hypothetical protein